MADPLVSAHRGQAEFPAPEFFRSRTHHYARAGLSGPENDFRSGCGLAPWAGDIVGSPGWAAPRASFSLDWVP